MRHDTNNVTDTEETAAVTVVCISADPGCIAMLAVLLHVQSSLTSELLLGPVFETKQRHQNRELNSNTDIAMIVADAVKETHSVGTAQTRSVTLLTVTVSLLLLPFSVQGSVFRRIDALLGEFRVGGGVHDSYTFQCGLVGSFTSPGIDTR